MYNAGVVYVLYNMKELLHERCSISNGECYVKSLDAQYLLTFH